MRTFLLGRIVVNEIEQNPHVQGPEGGGEEGANIRKKTLIADGSGEDGEALLAILERAWPQRGERVKQFAGETEESAEQSAVALEDLQFGVEGDREAFFEGEVPFGKGDRYEVGVFGLNVVIVGLDDGLFAGEVVVSRAERDVGRGGQVAHGGGVQAALSEALEGDGKDVRSGGLALGSGCVCIEHVQILPGESQKVKKKIERVRINLRILLTCLY